MDKADFNIINGAIKLVEDKVHRDFIEINNLQNSSLSVSFVNKTIDYLQKKFYDYFSEKRPNYSLSIKNYKDNNIENSKYKIFVNPISGIKNYLHAIPYFCSIIYIMENNEIIIGVVHNYSTNEMFYVIKGQGSFLNNQKLRVSNRSDNLLFAVKYDLNKKIFSKILSKLPMFKINNCSILDCCFTSSGKYDASILIDSDPNEMLLGELFIKEAGGMFKKINKNNTINKNNNETNNTINNNNTNNIYIFSNSVCFDGLIDGLMSIL